MRYCRAPITSANHKGQSTRANDKGQKGGAADAPTRPAGIEPGGPADGAASRGGAIEISGASDPARHPVPARRRVRRRRPALGGPGQADARHRRGREHRRRRRCVGCGRGRACAVRRLYPSARRRRCAGAHADRVEPAAVRSGAGFRADRAPGHDRARDRGASRAAGEDARRIDRLRQEQSRQAVLRVGRRRLHEPAHRRTVQVAQRRYGHRACALQGRRSRRHRSHQRTDSDCDPERHRADPRAASTPARCGSSR